MDSTCLHVWGVSVVFVLLCFPHSLLICLFIFVLVDSLFYWPVCFLRSERKKAWTYICGEVGKIWEEIRELG